jgi:hypothetical protein
MSLDSAWIFGLRQKHQQALTIKEIESWEHK